MACETAFPWHENLHKSVPAAKIIVRLIEKAMSETRADDSSDQKSIEKRIQKSHRHSFPLEEPLEDIPSKDESRNEKHRVPPQFKRSQSHNIRIHIPMYRQHLKHNNQFLSVANIE